LYRSHTPNPLIRDQRANRVPSPGNVIRRARTLHRVHYLITQLLKIGHDRDALLKVQRDSGAKEVLTEPEFTGMKDWPSDDDKFDGWLNRLEDYNVFVSFPLDLDFAMLRQFPSAYHKAKTGRGPRIPDRATKPKSYAKRVRAACQAVLKSAAAEGLTYSDNEKRAFIWYQHLFLGRGKPSTHILAMNEIPPEDLWKQAPTRLKRLIKRVRKLLK
jgi:hypothetical protein